MQIFAIVSSTTISFAICLFVLFCITHRNGIAFAQLTGSQEVCNNEDQAIEVSDLPSMKCFNCTCKNGFVECARHKCSTIDGCYVLHELQKGECCQKCKGCVKDDVYHESGTEWTDPKDPCKYFICNAGIITEGTITCYTPCSNPTPPKRGQCCPTCSSCYIDGKIVTKKSNIISKEDPCVSCDCESGILTCVKNVCPVLNCPESKLVHGYEKCCSQCLGSGKYMNPPNGACLIGTTVYQSGTQFTLDQCTQCICSNSTLHCQKQNCPILRCKRENQETKHGQCCPQCKNVDVEESDEIQSVKNYQTHSFEDESENREIQTDGSCTYDDQIYDHGETWNTSTCQTCTCIQGKVNCESIMCPAINCPHNSVLKIPEGQCCPICEDSQGVCTVFGGSHFRTYDRKLYAFIGSCKYQLTSDCDSGTFNIRLKNTVVGNDVTIKRISLKLGNTRVDLQQNKNTKVNDEVIDLPYKLKNKLEIIEANDNIIVNSVIGVNVQWNYMGFLEVTVLKSYRKKLCGLCGNFNSIATDDLTTREGILVDDPAIFAQSWTTGDEVCLDTRKYGIKGCNPRKDQRLCNYIRGSPFSKCLKKINVTAYYETCLKDMCECPPDDLQCHCESFDSYVRDCRRLGILLPRWRKSVGC